MVKPSFKGMQKMIRTILGRGRMKPFLKNRPEKTKIPPG